MSPVLLLHIFAIAFWFGLIAVETAIELQNGRRSPEADYAIAHYHYLIDTRLEIPTILVVLATGALLFDANRFGGLYAVKVIGGVVAMLANIVCVVPVFLRKRAAEHENYAAVQAHTRLIVLTIIGLPGGLTALAIGMYWLGGGQ